MFGKKGVGVYFKHFERENCTDVQHVEIILQEMASDILAHNNGRGILQMFWVFFSVGSLLSFLDALFVMIKPYWSFEALGRRK
jgi:hypothetical protein